MLQKYAFSMFTSSKICLRKKKQLYAVIVIRIMKCYAFFESLHYSNYEYVWI